MHPATRLPRPPSPPASTHIQPGRGRGGWLLVWGVGTLSRRPGPTHRRHPLTPPPLPPSQATHKGLSSEEAAKRLEEYGPNKLPEETRNPILVYLSVRAAAAAAAAAGWPSAATHTPAPRVVASCPMLFTHPAAPEAPAAHCDLQFACKAAPAACLPCLSTLPRAALNPASSKHCVLPPPSALFQYMWNPLSWAMEAAAIIAIALLDYADFALILALLLVNATISYVEEANADKAIKALTSGEVFWGLRLVGKVVNSRRALR